MTDVISPVEANLLRFIHLEKENFVGRSALKQQMGNGTTHVLSGLALLDRGIAREGCLIYPSSSNTGSIGKVTSGGVGIQIGRNIALAMVERPFSALGTVVWADVRGRLLKAEVVSIPFYRKPVG